jgi:N-acetylmuramoyl-L-alanine amidase
LKKYFIFSLAILLLAAPALAAPRKPVGPVQHLVPPMSKGGPLAVEGIRFGVGGDRTRIVIDFSGKPDFRAFLLDNPKRLAVDIPRAGWKTARNTMVGEGVVRGYRSGLLEEEGLMRVMFDLKGPVTVGQAFVLPRDSMAKDRIVIDLKPASQNVFAARTAEIYGNKGLKGEASARAETSPLAKIQPPRTPADTHRTYMSDAHRVYTIVVDAGHGGQDPGAAGGGRREKNITLAVAQEIRRQLEDSGRYKVVLTRDRDVYIKLRDRVDISRRVQGDLFVSIHADKIDRQGVRGASVYTLSETASDAETARLAEDENNAGNVAGVDLKEESQDVADILLDLAMREKMNESNLLAKAVVEAFRRKNVGLLPNSHRSAGFAVLKAPDVPAILIETGFISNPDEANLLSSSAFQQKIASAVQDGIDAYFRKMQSLQKSP